MKKIFTLLSFLLLFLAQNSNAAVTGDTAVCANDIETYTVPSGGSNYAWAVTGGNVLTGVNTNTATIQWGLAGVGTIVVTQTNPVLTHTLTVTIHPKPTPVISHPPYTTCPSTSGTSGLPQGDRPEECEKVCKGFTMTYTTPLVPGHSYQWVASGYSVLTPSSNSATVTWDTTSFGWIMVIETNAFGCVDSFRICIEKLALPVASFTNQANACKFSSVLFNNTSTGATSYQWYFGDGGSSTLTNPIHAYNTAGNFTITLIAKNNCGCVDTFQSTINIDSLPGPDITCIETVCAFDTAMYSTTPSGGCTYTWLVTGGTIISGQGTPNVTIAWGAGQIGKLGLVITGCPSVCSDTTYTYIPIVPATAVISGPSKICSGDCATFTLPRFSGAGYTWTLNSNCGGIISDTICCEQVEICYPAFANCNDTLFVTYFDTFLGCGGSAMRIIRVRPHLDIIGNTTVCANSNAQYNGFAIGVGPVICQWSISPTGPVITPGGPSPSISINWNNVPGTYVLTAIPFPPGQVCDDSVKILITVVAPPLPPVITGDTVVCTNSTVQYCSTSGSLINWIITGGTPVTSSGNCITVNWGIIPPFIVRAYQTAQNSPFCSSDTTMQNITPVLSVLPPVIIASSPVCANGTSTFSTSTLYPPTATYTWSVSPGVNGAVIAGQGTTACTVEWGNNAPSVAIVTLTVSVCNQTNSNFATVTLNPPPVPSAVQLGSLCAGGTAQLQASGGLTYNWNGPATSNSPANPLTITQQGMYSVTVTAANGCTALSQINVQYVSGPTASISTLNYLSYCIGGPVYSVNMCALGNVNYTYAWNVGGPTTQCRSFNAPGAYSVIVTDITNSCTALSNVLVISEDTCIGGPGTCNYLGKVDFLHTNCNPIVFTNTSVNTNGNYTWNFGDLTTSNLVNPTHTYTQAGFYIVSLTAYVYNAAQTDSCLVTDTAQIEIPLVAKFDFKSKCYNDSVCFTDKSTFTAGNSITSWNWNFGDATISTQQSPCHVYGVGGNFIVTLVVGNGLCFDTITDTVSLNPKPTANFSFVSPNCINNAVQFTDLSIANINYWSWTFGDGGTSLNQNPQHSYSIAGTFIDTLIVRDTAGCADTVVQNITINAPVNYGNIWASDTIVCAGTPVLLVTPFCGTCTYLWNTNSTNDSITVNTSGIYTVDINDGSGCIYSTFINIIVNNGPPAVIQNTGDDELCVGESTTLFVQANNNWLYQWISNDVNVNGQTTNSAFVFASIPGTYNYQVILTDTTTGCSDTSLLYIVIVHQNPVPPTIVALGPTTICFGDTIVLVGSHPDLTVTYLWNTGSVNDTISVTKNGCYNLEVTDTNGCSASNIFCVTVNPLPDLCTFYEGCFDTCAPYTMCAPAGSTYQWLNNGLPLPGDTMQCLTTSLSGMYSVIVSNSFGCVDTTGVLDLTLYPCPDSLCADFWIDSVACDSNGNYVIFYHVANQSQIPVTQVNLEVLQPNLGIAFAPAVVFTTIPSQGTSGQLSAIIYNGNPGDSLCFRVHILAYDSMGHEEICCYSDTDCIVLDSCDKHPVDTTCCYFNFLGDSSSCLLFDPVSQYYTFNWQINGCGTLSMQTGNNVVINGNNPLVLTGNTVTVTGTYTPTGPADTIMCVTFVMSQGNVFCADTSICFVMGCDTATQPQHPVCDLNFQDSICVGQTSTYSYGGNPTGLTFQWQFTNGSPATATGPGPHTVTYNTAGCYQVICIISSQQGILDCIDTICVLPPPVASVSQNGNALFAFPAGYNYQWYSGAPANNTLINGAVNQFYNPSVGGFYCVIVSNGPTCADTACIDFIQVGIGELNEADWNIFPNPNEGAFSLRIISHSNETVELKVMNAIGELVDKRIYETHSGEQNFYIANQNFAGGVYFIQLKTEKGTGMRRMVVR